jgi:hypothetical protein
MSLNIDITSFDKSLRILSSALGVLKNNAPLPKNGSMYIL